MPKFICQPGKFYFTEGLDRKAMKYLRLMRDTPHNCRYPQHYALKSPQSIRITNRADFFGVSR